jgi:hypothetical protein
MAELKISDILGKQRLLVSRDSARSLGPILKDLTSGRSEELELDFDGIEGITPSFLDELLGVLDIAVTSSGNRTVRILLRRPPTRLSTKFSAVGEGRGFEVSQTAGGDWMLTHRSRLTA